MAFLFKRFFNRDKKIVSIFLYEALFIVFLVIILIGIFWISNEYNTFNTEITKIKEEYLHEQKVLLKGETEKAVNFININRRKTKSELIDKLKTRVNDAYAVSANMYYENINDKSKTEIIKLISDALRPIRFFNNKGTYSIINKNGDVILNPENPNQENKNIIARKDKKGNFIVKERINLINVSNEGLISEYWNNNDEQKEKVFERIVYVKYFKPLDIIISANEFLIDYEENVKKSVLNGISQIRFENGGYIFINTYNGKALITDGEVVNEDINLWNLEDPNGIKVIQEERKAVENKDGDFIYYSWRKLKDQIPMPKMSFVKGVSQWQWIIGAGVYIDEVNKIINNKREELEKNIKKQIVIIVIVLLFILIVILLFYGFFARKAKKNLQIFLTFFNKAAKENILIDVEKMNFYEFKILASYTNKIIKDIRKAVVEKEKEKAYFERLFDIAPEAIAILDIKGRIKRVNQEFVNLFGFEQEELVNKEVDRLIVPENLFEQARINTIEISKLKYIESDGIRICKNGKRINVSIIATSIELKYGQLGIYVIYRDITQQKEFENRLNEAKDKAEESERLKSSFLANISHEIRTPMNSILGFSSLLETPDISKESKSNYIKYINTSGIKLLKIIDDIIDISKLEAQELTININKCNLKELFDELLFIFSVNNKAGVDLKMKIEKSNNIIIYSDYRRLKQIMSCFIDNGLKFTEKGFVEFGYKILDSKIQFYVKDTGIGLSEDKKKIIFDKFRQVEENYTRKYGGAGIGLAISKELVHLLGGKIEIESKEGEGTLFSFCLPYKPESNKKINLINNNKPELMNWKGKKIIVAEDEENNYFFIESILKHTKASILWAKNGEEVLELINAEYNPDIILMDVKMPKLNGNSTVKIIREKNINIPIIAQTAYALLDEQSQLLEYGYNDIITKPYNIKSLINIVAKYLS